MSRRAPPKPARTEVAEGTQLALLTPLPLKQFARRCACGARLWWAAGAHEVPFDDGLKSARIPREGEEADAEGYAMFDDSRTLQRIKLGPDGGDPHKYGVDWTLWNTTHKCQRWNGTLIALTDKERAAMEAGR